ncbi:hypothetical protein DENSPDRAFT_831335 [Dentipellis sp. KUC8613]|nr:hypothetical protein DENSPDRAFT_831335 [Dentipellis sp. KUC8613]
MLRPIFAALSVVSTLVSAVAPPLIVQEPFLTVIDDVKVPVVLGVMSRCPDALLCEAVFDQVLKKVSDKVDFSLTYVAKTNTSDPDFGVTCMHGAQECAGNVHQLCAAKYLPLDNWWEFVMCQNYQGREKIGRPDIALKCARSAQIDWETSPVGQCAGLDGSGTEEEGTKLLQDNVKATQALGIKKSCTIVINGEQVCVHDGAWKECENGHSAADFIRQINTEYDKLNGAFTEDEESV